MLVAHGVWATLIESRTNIEWSRLATVDTKAQDEAACAVSSAVWTLGVCGMAVGGWQGKARSLQLPIVRIYPTPTQPPTNLR
jgi:hypothetical protein